jgi:hypothetical protein
LVEPSNFSASDHPILQASVSAFAVINAKPYTVYIYVSCIVVVFVIIVGVLIFLIKKQEGKNKQTLKFPINGIKFEIIKPPIDESSLPQKVIAGVISKQNIALDESETIKEIEEIQEKIKQLRN